MKVAILTLPLHTNYGGLLQAYALQTVLQRLGNDVRVIEEPHKKFSLSWRKAPFAILKRFCLRYLCGRQCYVFYERMLCKNEAIISKYTDAFIGRYVNKITYRSFSNIKEGEYDVIIVGSDQIWRPRYFKCITKAYLSFAKRWNVKRVAYAASFGSEKWEYTVAQTYKCSRLLRFFDAISIREDIGCEMCKRHFGREASHVLDPTFLLNVNEYIQLIKKSDIISQKGHYIFNYILDISSRKIDVLNAISRDRGLNTFKVNAVTDNIIVPISDRIQQPVEAWLDAIRNAEFVVTDSFHACVFSILFNKPFVAIGNKKRGLARFYSLLKMFSLENRLIETFLDYKSLDDIDYSQVNSKIESLRVVSFNFLEKAIKS